MSPRRPDEHPYRDPTRFPCAPAAAGPALPADADVVGLIAALGVIAVVASRGGDPFVPDGYEQVRAVQVDGDPLPVLEARADPAVGTPAPASPAPPSTASRSPSPTTARPRC